MKEGEVAVLSQNSFNLEVVQNVRKAIALIEELPEQLRKGTNNFVDVAKFTGSTKLEATAQNQAEATEDLIKSIGDVVESANRFTQHYKNLEETL